MPGGGYQRKGAPSLRRRRWGIAKFCKWGGGGDAKARRVRGGRVKGSRNGRKALADRARKVTVPEKKSTHFERP